MPPSATRLASVDGLNVRPAAQDDLPAIARVSAANNEPVIDPDRSGSRYLDHLLGHARLRVAESAGEVVGFAGAIAVPAGWFLTDLFVAPAVQGRGVGRALLAETLPATGSRLTFSSADRRALPIYVRAGMSPWWPLLYLRAPSPSRSTGGAASNVELADGASAAALERELTGHDRSRDWAFWAAGPNRRPFAVLEVGRPVAVGVGVGRRLGRLAIGPDADPVVAVLAALAGTGAGTLTGLAVPGPHPATRILLDQGWLIEGADTHLASGPDLLDPTRLLPDPSLA
jgi:GNAT superfamily N-acetyltransferase